MIEDRRGAVGGAGSATEQTQGLAERLDREILPCLERPGHLLGPFGVPSVSELGRRRVALIWPSEAQDAHVPEPLRPLFDSARFPRESELSLCALPSADFASALRERGLPCVVRPSWSPLSDQPLWLVWLEHPLQILGLLTLCDLAGIPLRHAERRATHPRIVACGPGAGLSPALTEVFVDGIVDDPCAPGFIDALTAAHERGELDSLLARRQEPGSVGDDFDWTPSVDSAEDATDQGRPRRRARRLGCASREEFFESRSRPSRTGDVSSLVEFALGSGSASLRGRIGAPSAPADGLLEALAEQENTLVLRFGVGWEGETEADRLAIAEVVNRVVDAAPRGVRQVRVELQELLPEETDSATPIVFAEVAHQRVERIRAALIARRVQIDVTLPGEAAVLRLLRHHGIAAAAWLEALHRAGIAAAEDERLVETAVAREGLLRLGPVPWAESEDQEIGGVPAPTGLPDRFAVSIPAPAPRRPKGRQQKRTEPEKNRWVRWQAIVPRQFDYRIEYSVEGRLRHLGPGDTADLFFSACRSAQLPLAYSGVVQPKPKISFGPALPSGLEGMAEYVDLGLTTRVGNLMDRLKPWMPEGVSLRACCFVPAGSSRIPLSRIDRADYEARFGKGNFRDASAFEFDRMRVRTWGRRLAEGLTCGEGSDDTLNQLCAIRWIDSSDDETILRYSLDLGREGAKCKPREVLVRALEGLDVDSRLLPLRRLRLLGTSIEQGRARLRTPLEFAQRGSALQRFRERFYA